MRFLVWYCQRDLWPIEKATGKYSPSPDKIFVLFVGRDGVPVRRPDSQSREPSFKSHCGHFEPLASLITPHYHSSVSCVNEYLAIQTVVEMWTNSLRAIAAWLNASQRI